MKRQPLKPVTVALYGITAALWLLNCLWELRTSGQVGNLRVLCAVVWIAAFFVQFRRYQNQK